MRPSGKGHDAPWCSGSVARQTKISRPITDWFKMEAVRAKAVIAASQIASIAGARSRNKGRAAAPIVSPFSFSLSISRFSTTSRDNLLSVCPVVRAIGLFRASTGVCSVARCTCFVVSHRGWGCITGRGCGSRCPPRRHRQSFPRFTCCLSRSLAAVIRSGTRGIVC